jgi:hypothetical protein
MPVTTGVISDLRIAALVVLAVRDMAAGSRHAAALHRAHHLELAEAHVTAVGVRPSGPWWQKMSATSQGWTWADTTTPHGTLVLNTLEPSFDSQEVLFVFLVSFADR